MIVNITQLLKFNPKRSYTWFNRYHCHIYVLIIAIWWVFSSSQPFQNQFVNLWCLSNIETWQIKSILRFFRFIIYSFPMNISRYPAHSPDDGLWPAQIPEFSTSSWLAVSINLIQCDSTYFISSPSHQFGMYWLHSRKHFLHFKVLIIN